MIDVFGVTSPAKLSVPKHELHPLAFHTDAAVELIETLECPHSGACWPFRLRPCLPTRAPLSEFRWPLFVGCKSYCNRFITLADIDFGSYPDLATGVLP